MSINDKNTGFLARRFSPCKEFMPASSMIFVVLVAHFESTCWKGVSLRVSTYVSLVPERLQQGDKVHVHVLPMVFLPRFTKQYPFVTGLST